MLVFQRALYAKVETTTGTSSSDGPLRNISNVVEILPDWSWTQYLAYLGYTAALGAVLLVIGTYVFGRLEANFAEEL